jgi:hypothetical protein
VIDRRRHIDALLAAWSVVRARFLNDDGFLYGDKVGRNKKATRFFVLFVS